MPVCAVTVIPIAHNAYSYAEVNNQTCHVALQQLFTTSSIVVCVLSWPIYLSVSVSQCLAASAQLSTQQGLPKQTEGDKDKAEGPPTEE